MVQPIYEKKNGYSFGHYFTPNKITSTLALFYFKCCHEVNIIKLHLKFMNMAKLWAKYDIMITKVL